MCYIRVLYVIDNYYYIQENRMKALKILGTGLVCSAIYTHLTKEPNYDVLIDRIIKQGQLFKVINEQIGKTTIVVGAVALVGGIVYCVCKNLAKGGNKQGGQWEIQPEMLMNELSQCSSISTITAKQVYEELKCGITHELMVEPVSIACGHEFSKKAIMEWLFKKQSCPLCTKKSTLADIRPARSTAQSIMRFKRKLANRGREWVNQRIIMDFSNEARQ